MVFTQNMPILGRYTVFKGKQQTYTCMFFEKNNHQDAPLPQIGRGRLFLCTNNNT